MNFTDIVEGIKTGVAILQEIINFDVLWNYIQKGFEALIALF